MSEDRHEANRWTLVVEPEVNDYLMMRRKVLADGAARGFPVTPGESMFNLLLAGMQMRKKLTEGNGKIYDEERQRAYELIEFELKLAVEFAKLAMQLFREQLLNAVAIEIEEESAYRQRQAVDIQRMKAEIELRQVAIIRAKADAQHEVNVYQAQLIEAQRANLPLELALVKAQLATALAKLQIIAGIYQVIAAQQIVIAAEQRKAAAMEIVIGLEQQLALVKEAEIPLEYQKAEARLALAEATTADAQVRAQIEQLGFARNALRVYQEDVDHQLRGQEIIHELALENLTAASAAYDLFKAQSRTLLQEHANAVKAEVMTLKEILDKARIDLSLATHLARVKIGDDASIALDKTQTALTIAVMLNEIAGIQTVLDSNIATVKAQATRVSMHNTYTSEKIAINKG